MFSLTLTTVLLLPYLCMSCQDGTPCNTTSVLNGICVRGKCHADIPNMDRENLHFIIQVEYPDVKLKEHKGSRLYIRGNGLGLSWEKGTVMTKEGENVWSQNIKFKSAIGGFYCHACADSQHRLGNKFEYRILIDDTDDMLGPNFAVDLPLSEVSSYFIATSKTLFSYPWFYQRTGKMTSVVVKSPELGGNRTLAVYTPPSFYENRFKKFPILFAIDFTPAMIPQHIFDDPISKYGVTQEFVVIGFGDFKALERFEFLTPSRHDYFACINGSFSDNCAGCLDTNLNQTTSVADMLLKCCKQAPLGGQGDDTLDFLLNTALKAVQAKVQNRLKTDRENVGIVGYSLGGLMACYAAWTRPQNFGLAACQSPSLWWPAIVYNGVIMNGNEFTKQTLKNKTLNSQRPSQKLYIDVGGLEEQSLFTMADQAIEAAHLITQSNGYVLDKNVWVNVYPGAVHSVLEWNLRMWKALKLLFPSDGAPGIPEITDKNMSNSCSTIVKFGIGQWLWLLVYTLIATKLA